MLGDTAGYQFMTIGQGVLAFLGGGVAIPPEIMTTGIGAILILTRQDLRCRRQRMRSSRGSGSCWPRSPPAEGVEAIFSPDRP